MELNDFCWEEEGVWIPKGVPTFDWDDYKCVQDLGKCAVGYSYKVQQVSKGEFFAIKKVLISVDEVNDDMIKKRIMYDMSLATSLDHPNIMKCLGVCMNQCGVHFLYNWMPNNSCNRIIRDDAHLAQIAYQVLKGLNYLRNQKSLVFKHLTPGNILFDPSCTLVKIVDVGTVTDKYITSVYVSNQLRYMKYIAPENFNMDSDDEEDCTLQSDRYSKSDAWSLGLCLLEFYNGTFPFDGTDTAHLMYLLSGLNYEHDKSGVRDPPGAPVLFRDFVSSCLNLDESQRLGVDELLKHDFITTHCHVVSEQGDSSSDTEIPNMMVK